MYRRGRPPSGNTGSTLLMLLDRAWTTSSTAWASAARAPKHASWSRTRASRSTARWWNIASYSVKAGDTVAVREKAEKQPARRHRRRQAGRSAGMPGWVQSTRTSSKASSRRPRTADEFGADIKEALIVELYSR